MFFPVLQYFQTYCYPFNRLFRQARTPLRWWTCLCASLLLFFPIVIPATLASAPVPPARESSIHSLGTICIGSNAESPQPGTENSIQDPQNREKLSGPTVAENLDSGTSQHRELTFGVIYRRLLKPLARLVLFIGIGLFVGNLIESLRWTQKIGRIARPLIRWGRLNDHTAIAFLSAFFSGVTANTMLVNAYKDGKVSRRELIYSNLLNTLPSYFLHLPTTFFILLPLVRTAGVLYLTCTFSAALIRTIAVLTASRYTLKDSGSISPYSSQQQSGQDPVWNQLWRKFGNRLKRILMWTVPIYALFFLLNYLGLFALLKQLVFRIFPFHLVPLEALSVVAFQVMAEFTAGAAAAGALLDAGTLTIKQTVLVLLIGNVIASPVRALRHQLPYYMGIYNPRLGTFLLILGQTVRVTSVVFVMILFYLIYPN